MKSFVTLEEALEILNFQVESLELENLHIGKALGRVLGKTIYSPINNPPFSKSAMDGYSINFEDSKKSDIYLKVIDKIIAGEISKKEVVRGTAIKIMTGGPIPKGANSVIKQEDVIVSEDYIKVCREVKENENICLIGEDIKVNEGVLEKGKKLDYADIGIISSLGIEKIDVYKKPKVGFISTGDEVMEVGSKLQPGKIYNSNKYSILGRLEELGYEVTYVGHAADRPEDIGLEILKAHKSAHIILTTGGVSVGEKDIMKEVIDYICGEKIFWKIKIKPGSSVLCSKYNTSLILSLSGNPTAALTTFELLVKPTLEKMSGGKKISIERQRAELLDTFKKKSPRGRFLRGRFICDENGQKVSITQIKSGNGILSSTINSNCIIEVPEGNEQLEIGDIVNIIKL